MRVLAIVMALFCTPAAAQTITGPAYVVDGDGLEIAGTRIRLHGIDAVELRQRCEGHDGRVYECGRDARQVLVELTRGKIVTCEPRDRDKYGRIVAVCSTDKIPDLGAMVVALGWATDYPRYSHGRYEREEAEAKAEQLGLHSGRFQLPEQWRKEKR